MTFKYAAAVKAAKLDATGLNAYIGASALLRVYDGVQPANPDTPLGGQVKALEFVCNAAGFATVSGGTLTARSIANALGLANTTVTWARLFKADGVTPIFDCAVATSGSEIILSNTVIVVAAPYSFLALTITSGN